ncbi:MAG: YbbR-like domain-containing protein [Acidobacteriota bacterium]|nr:YbbR-like domain-containing protein [Acidobacteriota bacterium]
MRELLTRNLGLKLVSLVMAVIVWQNIASEPELATILSAPVEYKNYPKDLEISSNIVESVDIEARGPSGRLRDISNGRLSAIVDFSTVKAPGERTFTLTSAQLNLPRGIELIRIIPAQLRFRFEHRATRVLAVQVPYSGVLPAGVSILSTQVTPPTLTITGPESRVAAVQRAVSDPVDLTQVTADTQQQVSVYIAEPEVRFVGAPQVTVKIHVSRTPNR